MAEDGIVPKDEDDQVIFNQYSFCELVRHLTVEWVGISVYAVIFLDAIHPTD